MALEQSHAVFSATDFSWNSLLSVINAPILNPQAFHTFDEVSILILFHSIPGTSLFVIHRILDTGSSV